MAAQYPSSGLPAGASPGDLLRRGAAGAEWTATSPLNLKAPQTISGDGKVVADAAMTAASAVITSATANFTEDDENKIVAVIGAAAAGATLGTTIASVESPTSATLAAPAGTTVSDATLSYGTDDAAAIQATIDSQAAVGGSVYIPPGVYMLASRVIVPAGVQLVGSGLDYANFGAGAGNLIGGAPARSSVFKAGGAFNSTHSLIRFGAVQETYTSGNVSPSAQWMVFDGSYLAQSGTQTWAARGFFSHCWFGQGASYGLDMSGQNSRCFGCITENGAKGIASLLLNANDVKYFDGEVRNGGTAQIKITGNCGNYWIRGNDVFGNTSAGANIAPGVLIDPSNQGNTPITCPGMINNNSINATRGEMLKIIPGANVKVGNISFCNNRSYGSQSWPANAFGVIRIDLNASGSELRGLLVHDNNIDIGPGDDSWGYLAAYAGGVGTVDQAIFTGNVVRGVNQLFASFVPTHQDGNVWSKTETGTKRKSTARGVATFNGDGVATTFNIAHGMCETGTALPTTVNVTPASVAARDGWNIGTITETNIPIVFAAAPANGQAVTFHWEARL